MSILVVVGWVCPQAQVNKFAIMGVGILEGDGYPRWHVWMEGVGIPGTMYKGKG